MNKLFFLLKGSKETLHTYMYSGFNFSSLWSIHLLLFGDEEIPHTALVTPLASRAINSRSVDATLSRDFEESF